MKQLLEGKTEPQYQKKGGQKKKAGKGLSCGGLRAHRAGKGPGGCRGWGLGAKEQKLPRRDSHLWSQKAGDWPGSSSGFPGLSGWGKRPPLLLLLLPSWRAPPICLSCSLPGLPPSPPGPKWPGGGLQGHRTWPKSWADFSS